MNNAWYSRKWVNVLLHVLVWLFIFSLPFLAQNTSSEDRPRQAETRTTMSHLTYIIRNIFWVGLFYFNLFLLAPRYFHQRRIGKFAGYHILIFSLIVIANWVLHRLLTPAMPFNLTLHLIFTLLVYLFFFSTSTMFHLIRERWESDRRNQEKQTENLKTELTLLRSQVSPHFMFNVLNNMVALARKKSDLLEPSLIKLSSLMRYMIYEADEEKVPLEKEVDYLESYIDLQRQRFGRNLQVEVDIQPYHEAYAIEPMLLIPFVENAFKHGTGMIENAIIRISLRVEKGVLHFCVENKYNPDDHEVRDKSSGIGLANVKRRLNLLYGKEHSLHISKEGTTFAVSLQINLNT